MTATWPLTIPQAPLRDGFIRRPESNVIAFGTEVGEGKRRRRSTARRQSWAMTFVMTDPERLAFIAFFEDELLDGALPFLFTHPVSGITYRFLFDAESPYQVGQPGGTEYRISINVSGRPA